MTEYDKEKIKTYYRQYVGYINDKGEKLIDINLFNYDTPEGRQKCKDWQDQYVFGFDGFWTENTTYYIVNITKGEIE